MCMNRRFLFFMNEQEIAIGCTEECMNVNVLRKTLKFNIIKALDRCLKSKRQVPHYLIYAYKSCFNWLNLIVQCARSIWVILEGSWSSEAYIEEQARVEGGGRWYSNFVWAGVRCLVLCWWDRGKGIYNHWLPCLRKEICCWGFACVNLPGHLGDLKYTCNDFIFRFSFS